jgi:pimeloyl-ACP methyl ester carboxylesterase
MRWCRLILLLVLAVVAALAVAGASYQIIAARADERRFPEPGQMVDIGGFRLKIHCLGAGSPTVVLESGLGDVMPEWQPVQDEVAKFARVCSYDRAGYGGSDAGPEPRTSALIAGELHALLERAGEKPPYILVGHSFGGYNVRVFNGQFPNEVAALVLVDATQEDQYKLLPPAWNLIGGALLNHYQSQARWAPLTVNFGILRVILHRRGQDDGAYLILRSKYLRARASELEHIRTSAEQARSADHIVDKPLIVLTAGKTSDAILVDGLTARDLADYQHAWVDDLQMRLAHLSSLGKRIIVADSTHDIPEIRPQAVVDAVKEVRASVQH